MGCVLVHRCTLRRAPCRNLRNIPALFMLTPQADVPKLSAVLSGLHRPGRQGPVFEMRVLRSLCLTLFLL